MNYAKPKQTLRNYSYSKILLRSALVLIVSIIFSTCLISQPEKFSLKQVRSYPFPEGLTASSSGSKIAWTINKEGIRNIFTAEGPKFEARRITDYNTDDGQAITSLSISPDGLWCVFIRGGDFGSNWGDELPVNASADVKPPVVRIWSIPFGGGKAVMLADGINPVISPNSDRVAYIKNGQIWHVPITGGKPEMLFRARGSNGSPDWSPDGINLAFRSSRGDHSFIGIYRGKDKAILWVDPDYNQDRSPAWSKDGTKLAFVRQNGSGGAPNSLLDTIPRPWKIMVSDLITGETICVWKSPDTMRGSVPSTHGGTNLRWGKERLTFLSYHDGWPHLYSVDSNGENLNLLTPGNYMAEYISLSSDGEKLFFAGNTGPDKYDIDRRHIVTSSTDKSDVKVLTPGEGNEWTPKLTGDGKYLAYISAGTKSPPVVKVMSMTDSKTFTLTEDLIPDDYPTVDLVVPYQAIFEAADGTSVHGTVFNDKSIKGEKPAVIFIHGGPQRQMILGWHYSSYYSNGYAINQYLASRGFVVISVNYRLGIGYGYEFHRTPDGGTRGAAEYQDIVAAHSWLTEQSFIDPDRIGLYGGSYGGYLTAMGLGRNSDLFAAGVDISGVHNRTVRRSATSSFEKIPDLDKAIEVAWKSSPVAYVEGWKSPGLIIHADDDRNVNYEQSTDLVQRLRKLNAPIETLTLVDDTHHFMIHSNQLIVNKATVDFLIKHLMK